MHRTLNAKTEKAVQQRQREYFCFDCNRHRDFSKQHWFSDNGEYWVCDECIQAGRPEKDDQTEQPSLLEFGSGCK